MEAVTKRSTYARSGSISGAVSAFVFVVIHHIFISDIWFSAVIMIAAGAICGLCLGWSYSTMVASPSLRTWTWFNGAFVLMFCALGLVSVLMFEPRTTIAVLIEENEPPGDLIAAAMPLTVLFTVTAAAVITLLFGRTRAGFGAALVTTVVLVALLGLNVSIIGLVDIPTDSVYLVIELFALILALDLVFAVVFVSLNRKEFPIKHPRGRWSSAGRERWQGERRR
jgi:hypothetical protein